MTNAPRRLYFHILIVSSLALASLASLFWPMVAGAQRPSPPNESFAAGRASLPPLHFQPKANHKLESALAELVARERFGSTAAVGRLPAKGSTSTAEGSVRVVLEIEGEDSGAVQRVLRRVGGREEGSYKKLVAAQVPLSALEELAADPTVRYVRRPLESIPLSTTSEGVSVTNASTWQSAGLRGQSVKVAVLDGGFAGWQSRMSSGELPSNLIARSFRADGDLEAGSPHGTGCAEIVYDMAPGAQLYLVNFGNDVELGNAVDWLIGEGVKVISHSMGWFNAGPGDGTGIIDDIVTTARNGGILWANSAGNHSQRHWEGIYGDANGNRWHEFNPVGQPLDEGNSFYLNPDQTLQAFLSWDDWPSSSQDYDLYVIRSSDMQPVAQSTSTQNGSQEPTEALTFKPGESGWYALAIWKHSATRSVHFELYTSRTDLEHQSLDSSLLIPADSPNALTAGAVRYDSTSLEGFSSRGPTNGSSPRTKPDLVAPDGVSTVTYGSTGFSGTSAAAPHVAGAAALVLGAFPAYTPAQVQAFLEGRATDLGSAGKDNLYGSGRLNLGALPDAALTLSPTTITAMGEISGTYLSPVDLRIGNAGGGTLTWTATANANAPWLVVSPTSGTATASNPVTTTVTFSMTSLTTGTHDSSIAISASPGSQSAEVPVRLILLPNGQMRRIFLPVEGVRFGASY